jgi:ketosteroid isomerase-like protein
MNTDTASDADVVRAGFAALADGDLAGLGAMFHADATWNHRNDDRFGGVHRGRDAILAFIAESGQLTTGTLRALPEAVMADGDGRVAVLVRVGAERPDGRSFDDPQIMLFAVDSGHVRSVDQFVGDPAAGKAFWG